MFNKRRTEEKVELEYRKKRKGADDSEEERYGWKTVASSFHIRSNL